MMDPRPCIVRMPIGNGYVRTMRGYLETQPDGETTFTPFEGWEFMQQVCEFGERLGRL